MPKSVKTKKVIDGPFRKSMSKSKFIDFKHPIFLVFSNKTRFSPRFWLSCIQLQKVLIVGIKVYGFRAKKRKKILAHQGIEPGTSRLWGQRSTTWANFTKMRRGQKFGYLYLISNLAKKILQTQISQGSVDNFFSFDAFWHQYTW